MRARAALEIPPANAVLDLHQQLCPVRGHRQWPGQRRKLMRLERHYQCIHRGCLLKIGAYVDQALVVNPALLVYKPQASDPHRIQMRSARQNRHSVTGG